MSSEFTTANGAVADQVPGAQHGVGGAQGHLLVGEGDLHAGREGSAPRDSGWRGRSAGPSTSTMSPKPAARASPAARSMTASPCRPTGRERLAPAVALGHARRQHHQHRARRGSVGGRHPPHRSTALAHVMPPPNPDRSTRDPGVETARLQGVGESQGDRRRGRVAVAVDGHHAALVGDPEALGGRGDDAGVGLVGDEEVDVGRRRARPAPVPCARSRRPPVPRGGRSPCRSCRGTRRGRTATGGAATRRRRGPTTAVGPARRWPRARPPRPRRPPARPRRGRPSR